MDAANMCITQLTSVVDKSIDERRTDLLQTVTGAALDEEKELAVVQHAVRLLQKHRLPERFQAEVVAQLMLQVDRMPSRALTALADSLTDRVSCPDVMGGKWLDLLPKALDCMESRGESGRRSRSLDGLLSSEWNRELAADLVGALRDLATSDDEAGAIVERGFRALDSVGVDSVAPFVYQLLRFSVKGPRKALLVGILDFFRERADGDPHPCEGNVMLHVLFAVKYDQELGRELVKLTKMARYASDFFRRPFFLLSLCLAACRIDRFKEQVLAAVGGAVARSLETSRARNDRGWLRAAIAEPADVREALLAVARKCSLGWDHVTDGMVDLGLSLLDAPAPCGRGAAQRADARSAELGLDTLTAVFEDVRASQKTIVTRVLNGVSCASQRRCHPYYARLLSRTVRRSPYAYLDCAQRVKTTFETFLWAPYGHACAVLDALDPLLALNRDLRDSLLLIIRKAAFSRQPETRRLAAYALLKTLANSPVVELSVATDCRSELVRMCGHALATQQLHVRVVVYEGLPRAMTGDDAVLQLLENHVGDWWNPASGRPLDRCFSESGGQVVPVEPLPDMLRCVNECLKAASSGHGCGRLRSVLEGATEYFAKSDPEDFEMDANWDGDVASAAGKRIAAVSAMLFAIYDALVEFLVWDPKPSVGAARQALRLFSKRRELSGYLAGKRAGRGKSAKKKTNPESPARPRQEYASGFSRRSVGHVLSSLLESDSDDGEAIAMLREDDAFVSYVAAAAVESVARLGGDASDDRASDAIFAVGRALFQTYLGKGAVKKFDRKISLQGFVRTLGVAKELFPERLEKFTVHVLRLEPTAEKKESPGSAFVERIKPICSEICDDESKERDEEAELLAECARALRPLPIPESDCAEAARWLRTLCEDRPVGKAGVDLLTSLLRWLSAHHASDAALFRDACHDVRVVYGEDSRESGCKKLAMVSESTAAYVTKIAVEQFHATLADVERVLNAAKTGSGNDHRLKLICVRLNRVTACLHHLVRTSLPRGPNVGAVLRCLVNHYGTLTALTRHVLGYAARRERLNEDYDRLVRTTGTQLTQHVYGFFLYVQSQEPGKKKQAATVQKIPNVVYAIETFERSLIQLGKKLEVNLMSGMKLSAARDFRIDLTAVTDNEQFRQAARDGDGDDGDEPRPKKRKLLKTARRALDTNPY